MRLLPLLLVGCMAWVPRPRVAEAPLGLAQGPQLTVRSMLVATTKMSAHLAVAGVKKTEQRAPVWVFVVEHPTQGTILIDSAFGRRTQKDPLDYPGKQTLKLLDLEMGTPAIDQLAQEASIGPVKHVILTHVHHDHAGGVEDFTGATVWLSEEDEALGSKKRLLGATDPRVHEGVEFSNPAYDDGPLGPFPRHEDLFGDGSILLVPTPGHTPGSQVVLVNGADIRVLFAGDVSWTDQGFDLLRPKGWVPRTLLETDWRENLVSMARIVSLEEPGLVVVSGHEPGDIERLPSWPAPWTAELATTE